MVHDYEDPRNNIPIKDRCPKCDGYGYYSEHDDSSYDEHGEHDCSNCPIAVQCYECRATGKK